MIMSRSCQHIYFLVIMACILVITTYYCVMLSCDHYLFSDEHHLLFSDPEKILPEQNKLLPRAFITYFLMITTCAVRSADLQILSCT